MDEKKTHPIFEVFIDIVHGHMEFHPLLVSIINTPQFQRLRYIKQTGPCSYVFQSATHTRFEHSLGTAFLAGKLMDALNEARDNSGDEERKIREREKLLVQIAALCHDLGHGPFSHLWEFFLKRFDKTWKHEEASVQIFDTILKEKSWDTERHSTISIRELFSYYDLDGYSDMIKHMIVGKEEKYGKSYLYQVVSNKQNSVDVDKWDYLLRDSKMTSIPIHFDYTKLLGACRILETAPGVEEICFRDKECSTLLSMFVSRAVLHEKVYQHRKVKIIEEMLIDAFVLAARSEDKLGLKLTSTDARDISRLTDRVLEHILYGEFGSDENIDESRRILKRVQRRDLYMIAASHRLPESRHSVARVPEIFDLFLKNLKKEVPHTDLFSCTAISIQLPHVAEGKSPLDNIIRYNKKGKVITESCHDPDLDIFQDEMLVLYKGTDIEENVHTPLLKKVILKLFGRY
ncbi:UNVERIFIED_CONTAM: hypothetical protein PYX00_009844 [Menopon gallinae]